MDRHITDFFYAVAVGLSIYFISRELDFALSDLVKNVSESHYSRIFDGPGSQEITFSSIFSAGLYKHSNDRIGSGYDAEKPELQKYRGSKKNMYWMSSSLILLTCCF